MNKKEEESSSGGGYLGAVKNARARRATRAFA